MSLLPSFFMVQLAFAPLPPYIANALAEIEVEQSIDGPGMFRLHFDLSRTMIGEFDALVFDLFRPLMPIRISLSFGLGLPMTLINGFVRDVQLNVGNGPGSARMEVVGADALGTIMGHVQIPFTWPNIPDSAIVAAIFGKYGIVPMTAPTPPKPPPRTTTRGRAGDSGDAVTRRLLFPIRRHRRARRLRGRRRRRSRSRGRDSARPRRPAARRRPASPRSGCRRALRT